MPPNVTVTQTKLWFTENHRNMQKQNREHHKIFLTVVPVALCCFQEVNEPICCLHSRMTSGETFNWKMWVIQMCLDDSSKDFFVRRLITVAQGSYCSSSHVRCVSVQGMTLLMMGSAEALPEEPAVRPMFVEDMTEEQLASAVSKPENYQCR